VAAVGLSAQQLKETCHPGIIKRIRVDFKTHTDRGYTDGVENGFIIVDAVRLTGQILSVTIVGPRASEMISFFTLAMSQKISLYKIYRLVFPYPTYSSGILKVADFFMRETLTNLKGELMAYLKYRFAKPSPGSERELLPNFPPGEGLGMKSSVQNPIRRLYETNFFPSHHFCACPFRLCARCTRTCLIRRIRHQRLGQRPGRRARADRQLVHVGRLGQYQRLCR
jgi:hypothetical protein